MEKLLILCVDDERDVLDSVLRDLKPLEAFCEIEAAESTAEAKEVIADYEKEGTPLSLILCDHIMPDETGVNFLIALHQAPQTEPTKKILLTGQADLNDTIAAVNHQCLDFFIAKPWAANNLVEVVKAQLTSYVIENLNDPMPWAKHLDTNKILQAVAEKRVQFGE